MRVGVDARALLGHRGVARYTTEMVAELARMQPADEWELLVPGRAPLPAADGPDAGAGERLVGMPNVRIRRHPLPGRVLFGAAALTGRPRLDRLMGRGLDVVWAPAPAPLAVSRGVPFVLTVHDLSFLDRPRDFTAYERVWHRLARPRRLLRGAAAVMCVSRPVADAVRVGLGVEPERVAVVPDGVRRPPTPPTPERVRDVRARHALHADYVLCVGALEPRKEPELLLRAHARARSGGLRAELAFAGRGRLAGRLRGPGVHALGHVTPEDLDVLYREAIALAMPSRAEGFGLPPLEALARGTPAVVADLPIYGETVGGGALRFAPGNEEALAAALTQIAADGALRASLVAEGARAIAPLTWEAAARRARAVLAAAAAGGRP